MRKRGFLIAIEGIDGSGKTTICKWLVKLFNDHGYEAIYTFEPTNSKFVEALKNYEDIRSAELDALVYAADRLVHLKKLVIPALSRGAIIVMDRYYYSSIAYQGAMGAPIEWVIEINRYAIRPDLAIYIDVEPEIGLARIRGKKSKRFPEYEKLELLRKVRDIYLKLVEMGWLKMVDGRRDIELVKNDVLRLIEYELHVPLRR
mgnify:CR=1 FL=1